MKSTPYRRIAGASGISRRQRLWLGPDHALFVNSNVLSEEYRRFYYSDIQAIVIAQVESPARFYGWVVGAMTGIFMLALVSTGHPIWATLCALACAGFIAFALTRPAVRWSLQTRTSTQELPPLRTPEAARAALEALREEIEKAQGPLPAEWLSGYPDVAPPMAPPPLHPYRGAAHYAAYTAMLLVAILTPFRLTVQSAALPYALAATHVSLIALAVIAAVKQHRSSIGRMARAVVAVALVWAAASYIAEQVIYASRVQDVFRNPRSYEYWSFPVRDVAVANAIAYVILGVIGLFAMLQDRPVAAE